jgi:hypothetical protein
MKTIPFAICLVLLSPAAMAAVPHIQQSYHAEKDELVHMLTAIDLAPSTGTHRGEFDLSAMLYFSGARIAGPPKHAVLAILWIGLERKFSTPAVLAVEIDGAEVFKTAASHHEEIDGGTIDENVSAELDVALLKRIAESESVIVRVDELRFALGDVHRARLRELLRAAE